MTAFEPWWFVLLHGDLSSGPGHDEPGPVSIIYVAPSCAPGSALFNLLKPGGFNVFFHMFLGFQNDQLITLSSLIKMETM